jgi:hypothetical protein
MASLLGSWVVSNGGRPAGAIGNASYVPYMTQDVTAFGDAGSYGSTGVGTGRGSVDWLAAPIVGMAANPTGRGYWEVGADGGVFTYGDAPFLGSLGGTTLSHPVVGMAPTPSGLGYWLVAADGLVTAFGDARLATPGSVARGSQPIVGMAATPSGLGYWLVAPDGEVFPYGDAIYAGSLAAVHLNQPVVGMAATPSGKGYWLVAADGGVFTFGDALFAGSLGGVRMNQPVVGMAATRSGKGYWLAAADGGVFTFGDARFYQSLPTIPHTSQHIVGMAATPDGGGYWLVSSGFCGAQTSTAPVAVSGATAPPLGQVAGVIGYPGCRDEATGAFRYQLLFRFDPPSPAAISFDVRYVSTPTPGPSGMPVVVPGHAFLEITLHGVTTSTVDDFGTNILSGGPPFPTSVQKTEDFEGVVRWVVSFDQALPFSASQIFVAAPDLWGLLTPNTNALLVDVG